MCLATSSLASGLRLTNLNCNDHDVRRMYFCVDTLSLTLRFEE